MDPKRKCIEDYSVQSEGEALSNSINVRKNEGLESHSADMLLTDIKSPTVNY